jgi:F5/8 type C domain
LGQFIGRLLHTYRRDPFFFVDLGFFLLYVGCAYRIFERFLRPVSALAASLVLIQASVDLFVTPWTSTVAGSCIILMMSIFTSGRYTTKRGVLAGLAGGLTFGARVGDAILVILISTYLFFDRSAPRRARSRFAISALTVGALISAVVIFVNLKFSGYVLGNYFNSQVSQGFTLLEIPTKLYGYFINPFLYHRAAHPLARPILARAIFLLLAPLGLALMVRRSERHKGVGLVFLLGLAGWALLYVPFPAVTGLTLVYGSQHYVKPILPAIVGAGFYAVENISEIGLAPEETKGVVKLLAIYGVILLFLFGSARLITFPRLVLSPSMLTSSVNPAQLDKMIDGDLKTRWDSGRAQQPGMEFDLDLGKTRRVQRIVIDTEGSADDYPRILSILYSSDGKQWRSWKDNAANQSETPFIIDFVSEPRAVRWLRFIQMGADPQFSWSVHELSLYGR